MAVKEFSGKTIDEAKAAAAAELGISADELVYEVMEEDIDDLADLSPQEETQVRTLATRIKPGFYEKAFNHLEDALSAIASNVNPKLVFCDLGNRLLLSL